MTPATIRNRHAIPGLVRRALRRLVATVAVAQYVAERVRAVIAAKRERLLARCAACSQSGKDSRRRTDKQPNAPYNRHRAVAA